MNRNFINIDSETAEKRIYRIIPVGRLFELFETGQNVLVKPKCWDDPFENFMMNSTGELGDGQMFSIGFRDHFFGQCWTKTRESDAMWRIYSADKMGVRISSTPKKLFKSLYDCSGEYRDLSCFIGSVKYYSTKKLSKLLETHASSWVTDQSGIGQAQTLLFKRISFKHENEIRLIYNSHGKVKNDLFKYRVDPIDLIDDIVFDPRINYHEFITYKKEILRLGFKNRIVKSNLYKAPKLTFRLELKNIL